MHAAPRFGHTNVLGEIASKNHGDAVDYAQGVSAVPLCWVVGWLHQLPLHILFVTDPMRPFFVISLCSSNSLHF